MSDNQNYSDPDDFELDGPEVRVTAQQSDNDFNKWMDDEHLEETHTEEGVYLGDGIYFP